MDLLIARRHYLPVVTKNVNNYNITTLKYGHISVSNSILNAILIYEYYDKTNI